MTQDSPTHDDSLGGTADDYLELTGVSKTYAGGIDAVEDLSLSLADGELMVLVGPSGCGKSTTLRMIAGLEEPTGGDIAVEGESVVGSRPEERDIAMVFQNYALYPHMTARENLSFGLRMTTDLSADEIATQVESVAETLGVADLLDKKPAELSGGQQQRIALGRAIVRDPSVFLLDEPLSNLDATLRGRMRTEIQQLQRDLEVTTVYVTHDQTEAMTMGDRVAVLNDGRVQQVDTPLACYHEPANLFVAGFVGEPSMNTVATRRTPDAFEGPITYPQTESLAEPVRGSERVTIGIRPEDVQLVEVGHDETTFSGVVDVIEPVGERSFVYVSLEAGPQMTVSVGGTPTVRETETVGVRLPPDRVHLFDTDDGGALHHPERRPMTTGPVGEN